MLSKNEISEAKKYKLEIVRWLDAAISVTSWNPIEDVELIPKYIHTTGYVIKEDDLYVLVAPHYIDDSYENSEQIAGWFLIPKSAILERHPLSIMTPTENSYIP